MLSFNSSLLSIAADFVGTHSPFQTIQITPAPSGGVFLASTDKGNIACLAHDSAGSADETINIIPSKDLARATKGIKTGDRNIRIEDSMAVVTTYKKTTQNQVVEIPIVKSTIDFPDLSSAITDCLKRWSMTPETSETAGRYNISYINKAIKSLSVFDTSITFSAFDGGPLRIQGASDQIVILVMPQTAEKIPPVPWWVKDYAAK